MRRKLFLAMVLGVVASVLAIGGAGAQTTNAHIAFVNGASVDDVTVTVSGPTAVTTEPIPFGEASEPEVIGSGSYSFDYSDGVSLAADVPAATAWNVVSQLADTPTALAFPVNVVAIPEGQATIVVWNAIVTPVQITVDGLAQQVPPGLMATSVTVDAGTTVTVDVSGVSLDVTPEADNYIDVFAVANPDAVGVATATIPSMQALVDALEPPANPTVPDVAGQTPDAATDAILAAGFAAVGEVDQPSEDVEAGLVIGTAPPAGTQAPAGSTVTLFVSTGSPNVEVPDVVGMSSDDASAALEAAGLTSTVVEEPSADVEAGVVISTNPAAGIAVAPGTAVAMTVSSGPPDVAVPDFLGLTPDEAQAIADDAGLTLVVNEDPDDPDPEGLVVEQDPVAGAVVAAGSEVQLLLGPATQDPWTSIKLDPDRILTAGGLNFLAGSVAEVTVVSTPLSASAVVSDAGYWKLTIDTNSLDANTAYSVVVRGTGEDGSAYERTFELPPPGETIDEPTGDDSVPLWVWLAIGILAVALVTIVVLLIKAIVDGRKAPAAEGATDGATDGPTTEGAAPEAAEQDGPPDEPPAG